MEFAFMCLGLFLVILTAGVAFVVAYILWCLADLLLDRVYGIGSKGNDADDICNSRPIENDHASEPDPNELTIIVKLSDKERRKLDRKLRNIFGSDFDSCDRVTYIRKCANDTPDELKNVFAWLFKTRK